MATPGFGCGQDSLQESSFNVVLRHHRQPLFPNSVGSNLDNMSFAVSERRLSRPKRSYRNPVSTEMLGFDTVFLSVQNPWVECPKGVSKPVSKSSKPTQLAQNCSKCKTRMIRQFKKEIVMKAKNRTSKANQISHPVIPTGGQSEKRVVM